MKMKHTLRETLVTPRATVPHVNGEAAQHGEAEAAQNVREQELSLQVTGMPAAAGAITPGDRLLLMTEGHHVTVNGRTVKVDGNPVATVDGNVLGAHAVGPLIVVVTGGGMTYLSSNSGSWAPLNPDDAVPQLEFITQMLTTSTDIAAYHFAEPYDQWQAPLASGDTFALERILRAAWNALLADAAADGRHAAPMLVRWAVRLHDDSYLWISDPVRVGDATLANADRISAIVDSGSAGFTSTQAATMALRHYRLGVNMTREIAADWLPLVKCIDVLATDEAQLLTASRMLDYRCLTRTTGGREYVLEMGLSRRSADAIALQLNNSAWHVVATATATGDMTGDDFVPATDVVSMTAAQCAAVGTMSRLASVASSTTAGGRLYCATTGGDVVVSLPGNALVEANRRAVVGSRPLALAVVTKPLYSSGFGRYPVFVFTSDGIFAIPQSASGTLGEARLVDRTVIAADVPPVEGDGDIWFVSRHRHLCRLSGSRVTVCQTDVTYTALAWCNAYRELWLLPARGYPVARMVSGAMSERTVDAVSLYSDALHAVVVTDAGTLLDLERETAAEVAVKWRTHPVALDAMLARTVRRIVWHVKSDGADVTLRVIGQRGIMAQDQDVSLVTVNGAINQPLAAAPIRVTARTLSLEMNGAAMSGTLLLPTLIYSGTDR